LSLANDARLEHTVLQPLRTQISLGAGGSARVSEARWTYSKFASAAEKADAL